MLAKNLSKTSIIYVAAPANLATGGPELLHQLVHEINKLNLTAKMYYYNVGVAGERVHPAYVSYHNPYDIDIIDSPENILIVPEGKTTLLYKYKKIKKVIWWLSVDNYYNSFYSSFFIKTLGKRILRGVGFHKVFKFGGEPVGSIIHLVQSKYAEQHLVSNGIRGKDIFFLSDYLNPTFIASQKQVSGSEKKNIVLYNPKKGIEFTKKIIDAASHIPFIPIQSMTREEVADLMLTAKVYIDFGSHPGKDRIPREAAISGACVITNTEGSAKYYDDVPIGNEFKFDEVEDNISLIISRIEECFENFSLTSQRFDNYRATICSEQALFERNVRELFLS